MLELPRDRLLNPGLICKIDRFDDDWVIASKLSQSTATNYEQSGQIVEAISESYGFVGI